MKMYEIKEFQDFYSKIKNDKMPLKVAYKLNLLFQEIEQSALFYDEKLNEIVKKYGKKDDDGNFVPTIDNKGIQIKENHIEECTNELNELSNLEVDIKTIKIPLEELSSIDLTLDEMRLLMPFIAEEGV